MNHKQLIAARAARELKDGDVVNLGIGLPTLVAESVPQEISLMIQSENGFIGLSGRPEAGRENSNVVDAGRNFASIAKDGAFFDSASSFAMIRGGHVDVTILGALQVDENGDIANWIIPGKMVPGMGGAMDLLTGARRVIVAMEHTNKGNHKILKKCTLPLTAVGAVDTIITEMGVMEVTEKGMILTEYHPAYTIEQIQEATGCKLLISRELKPMTDEGLKDCGVAG
ncbi:3-oxoacid CoA-transferase subunit B [Ruminococcus sp. OA3]|uniref:3-oxoacid CoA-transferase subunit B n=1 Tax=Ruminococcus sp. OA3 TaxID=2914164 RepID=UPI001F06F94A|nr:3-oxoacid CoA-transferase subunit B [Ruminococcus sp. OA3]MCH1982417.1 3-oxoacid CoA-transferase subunit B [Ruminococcus sp. OA3]